MVTNVQHKDICYQRRSLYIVITEEGGSPGRCETLTASDTGAPRASVWRAALTALVWTWWWLMLGNTSCPQHGTDGGFNASLSESGCVCASCVTVTTCHVVAFSCDMSLAVLTFPQMSSQTIYKAWCISSLGSGWWTEEAGSLVSGWRPAVCWSPPRGPLEERVSSPK